MYCSVVTIVYCRANLSRDYFVDRQDRYTVFKNCPQLTDYFAELVSITASHSFTLNTEGHTDAPVGVARDPLSSSVAAQEFKVSLNQSISRLLQKQRSDYRLNDDKLDTLVFPLLQMGYYGIKQDEECTQQLLQGLSEGDRLCLASGYFNLPPKYVDAIFQGKGEVDITLSRSTST